MQKDEKGSGVTIKRMIERAKRMGRIQDGLVLCDNCDTPASKKYSTVLSWTACGACAVGEAAEVKPEDFIRVSRSLSGSARG